MPRSSTRDYRLRIGDYVLVGKEGDRDYQVSVLDVDPDGSIVLRVRAPKGELPEEANQ